MVLYMLTISLGTLAIFLYNFFVNPAGYALWQIILFSVIQPVIMIAWDGLGAWIVHWVIPGKWFSADSNSVTI